MVTTDGIFKLAKRMVAQAHPCGSFSHASHQPDLTAMSFRQKLRFIITRKNTMEEEVTGIAMALYKKPLHKKATAQDGITCAPLYLISRYRRRAFNVSWNQSLSSTQS